ncbi:MAG: NADP-dependent oxidoreductase [Armatimonadota bacterium]
MNTMKAIRLYEFGSPDVLKYEEVPIPTPGPDEILIKVYAVGTNPMDWKIRKGYIPGYSLPHVMGQDFSGVVEKVGTEVTKWAPDDEVFGTTDMAMDGSYAEYTIMKESTTALKPKSLDHIHTAAIPLAALTAWQALFDNAGLSKGQRVLIHGAAGGVGHFAVQFAKWKGAVVIGTTSDDGDILIKELGAHEAIDYKQVNFEEVVCGVDVVLDLIGGDVQERSWKTLTKGGVLVSTVEINSPEKADEYGVRAVGMLRHSNAEQLTQIADLVELSAVRPIVGTVLPLSEAVKAHELLESGHGHGKIVLKVVD